MGNLGTLLAPGGGKIRITDAKNNFSRHPKWLGEDDCCKGLFLASDHLKLYYWGPSSMWKP